MMSERAGADFVACPPRRTLQEMIADGATTFRKAAIFAGDESGGVCARFVAADFTFDRFCYSVDCGGKPPRSTQNRRRVQIEVVVRSLPLVTQTSFVYGRDGSPSLRFDFFQRAPKYPVRQRCEIQTANRSSVSPTDDTGRAIRAADWLGAGPRGVYQYAAYSRSASYFALRGTRNIKKGAEIRPVCGGNPAQHFACPGVRPCSDTRYARRSSKRHLSALLQRTKTNFASTLSGGDSNA